MDLSKFKITDIEIRETEDTFDCSFDFEGREESFMIVKVGGKWYIDTTLYVSTQVILSEAEGRTTFPVSSYRRLADELKKLQEQQKPKKGKIPKDTKMTGEHLYYVVMDTYNRGTFEVKFSNTSSYTVIDDNCFYDKESAQEMADKLTKLMRGGVC